MSSLADGDELHELPAEFEGLPYGVKLRAFARAEAMLPVTALKTYLGTTYASVAWVPATCHVLALDRGEGTGEPGWEATAWGQQVAAILAQLPRDSGRGRVLPTVV